MIHAVALSLDEGASTAERLARESQRMDLSTNLALAGTTSDRVCLCEICVVGTFWLLFQRAVLAHFGFAAPLC